MLVHDLRVEAMTREWLEQVAAQSLGYIESLEATYDIARACLEREVLGDFVECGVFAGAHCAVMAKAIMEYAVMKSAPLPQYNLPRVHLFDSFQGLPAADERDQEIWAHHGAKTGEAACSLGHVEANMQRWGIPRDLLVYHKGWFHETVPYAVEQKWLQKIALLRLDGDLYSSTKPCMDHLYPLVQRGGWVIVDDWNLTGCRQAVNEVVVPAPIYWRVPTK